MAFLLGLEKATVEMPSKTVLKDVSLGVDLGDRIGIVGRNGDGKSTLLKVLFGELMPDEGRMIRTRGIEVGYLGQADTLPDTTVHLAITGDMPEFEWASNTRIRSIISGLLDGIVWESRISELSGGQRRRVDLARLLVGDFDVLMLDEPTNHLDMRAIYWLADHLKTRWRKSEGALLVVTHDRWFLDEVCNAMWEVHDGRVEGFEGGFSAYVMQRVERERVAQVTEQRRQSKLRRELAWLSRGARARATKPKFHVALAQQLIADVPELRNPIELKRMAMARIGKTVVELEDASYGYQTSDGEQKQVLKDITWIIGPGDRFGIIGENGAGKTTLLNLIQGKIAPTKGKIKIGDTVRFSVLSQHLDNLLEVSDLRVRQVVSRYSRRTMLDGKEQTPSQLLERLGFDKADLNEYVGDLSGGQKRRLALMMILLDEPNVLILDEPGNDLDVDMLAALEDLLDGWPGTLLLVTHDRYLMERVTDSQYALLDGHLRHLPRGVDEYFELTRDQNSGDQNDRSQSSARNLASSSTQGSVQNSANNRTHNHDQNSASLPNSELRRLKKLVASTEKKMDTINGRIKDAKLAMESIGPSDYVALTEAQNAINELELQLSDLETQWYNAQDILEGSGNAS